MDWHSLTEMIGKLMINTIINGHVGFQSGGGSWGVLRVYQANRRTRAGAQSQECCSTVLDFHILTKTVSDFVTLSKSGRLQAGSILWRKKRGGKKTTVSGPRRRNDKTSNDKEFDCIRVGGISGDQCVFVRSCRRPHSDWRAGERRAATAPLPC